MKDIWKSLETLPGNANGIFLRDWLLLLAFCIMSYFKLSIFVKP